jgi:hypothetical protein
VLGLTSVELPFPEPPRLLDRFRRACRVRQLSPRTEDCYANWVVRFLHFHGLRHPTMGGPETELFLTDLAANGHVAEWAPRTRPSEPCCSCTSRGDVGGGLPGRLEVWRERRRQQNLEGGEAGTV